ncbi:MAG: quinone-dependent dihydroorotate dehydrogenase [Gammaproteobacteria bacterium]|nr:quinone-dependent dihydroorotate dehydrogenase [Gammaproteobacteria bacterium]
MYTLIKSLLFYLDPEVSHHLSLKILKLTHSLKLIRYKNLLSSQTIKLCGLTFPNQIGLAAGFDKNGDYIDALASFGFGFIEVGTVTLKPQLGNAKPRIFRLKQDNAIINRLGFNNKGCDYLIERLKKTKFKGILGINIGKGHTTTLNSASDEYVELFTKLFPYASYITINISSPNTKDLRELQHGNLLSSLLKKLKQTQTTLNQQYNKYVPLVVKISPDLSSTELTHIADIFLQEKIDAVIATNTTIGREGVTDALALETGGLSGKPLNKNSTSVIKQLNKLLANKIPIIASGGILNPQDALEKINAGASLVQIYTGLVYSGPRLIAQLVKHFEEAI